MSDYHISLTGIGEGACYAGVQSMRVGEGTIVPASALPSPRLARMSGPTVSIGTNRYLYQQPSTIKASTPKGWWTNLSEGERAGWTFGGAVVVGVLAYYLLREGGPIRDRRTT